MGYAGFQGIIGHFVQDALKQQSLEAERTPSLQNVLVEKQYQQPNDTDCALYVIAHVIQLVRKTAEGYVMDMGEYTWVFGWVSGWVCEWVREWVCDWVSGWVCEGFGGSGSVGYSGSGLTG